MAWARPVGHAPWRDLPARHCTSQHDTPCPSHTPMPRQPASLPLRTPPLTGACSMPCSGSFRPGSRPRCRSSTSSHTTGWQVPWKLSGCSRMRLRRSCLQGQAGPGAAAAASAACSSTRQHPAAVQQPRRNAVQTRACALGRVHVQPARPRCCVQPSVLAPTACLQKAQCRPIWKVCSPRLITCGRRGKTVTNQRASISHGAVCMHLPAVCMHLPACQLACRVHLAASLL